MVVGEGDEMSHTGGSSSGSDPPTSSSQHALSSVEATKMDPQTILALQTNSVTNAVDDLMCN